MVVFILVGKWTIIVHGKTELCNHHPQANKYQTSIFVGIFMILLVRNNIHLKLCFFQLFSMLVLRRNYEQYLISNVFLAICRINNCVGETNQKFFILFTVSINILLQLFYIVCMHSATCSLAPNIQHAHHRALVA